MNRRSSGGPSLPGVGNGLWHGPVIGGFNSAVGGALSAIAFPGDVDLRDPDLSIRLCAVARNSP